METDYRKNKYICIKDFFTYVMYEHNINLNVIIDIVQYYVYDTLCYTICYNNHFIDINKSEIEEYFITLEEYRNNRINEIIND